MFVVIHLLYIHTNCKTCCQTSLDSIKEGNECIHTYQRPGKFLFSGWQLGLLETLCMTYLGMSFGWGAGSKVDRSGIGV